MLICTLPDSCSPYLLVDMNPWFAPYLEEKKRAN
jgi:hypothetical protein